MAGHLPITQFAFRSNWLLTSPDTAPKTAVQATAEQVMVGDWIFGQGAIATPTPADAAWDSPGATASLATLTATGTPADAAWSSPGGSAARNPLTATATPADAAWSSAGGSGALAPIGATGIPADAAWDSPGASASVPSQQRVHSALLEVVTSGITGTSVRGTLLEVLTAPDLESTKIHSVLLEVLVAPAIVIPDEGPVTDKPNASILLPDPLMSGSSVASATSESGPVVGSTVPAAANQGALLGTVLGDPDDETSRTVNARLVRGGGVGSAEWVYRSDDEDFAGYNAEIMMWGHHCPAPANSDGAIVLWSSVFRRVIVVSVQGSDVVTTYADANDRPTSAAQWAAFGSSTFTPAPGVNDNLHSLAGCELRDGTLLLAVRRPDIGSFSALSSEGDWDLYRSTDGGSSWRLALENLWQTFAFDLDGTNRATLRIAASGDWCRVCIVDAAGSILTMVSSDGGCSWKSVGDLTAGVDILGLRTDQTNDKVPFDLVGTDDSTGQFLIVTNPQGSAQVGFWYGSRDEDWVEVDLVGTITDLPAIPRAFVFLRDPYWLTLSVACAEPGSSDDRWEIWRAPRERALLSAAWDRIENPTRLRGALRLCPMMVRAVWCDDRGAMIGYQHDVEVASPYPRASARPWLCWVGGWSVRPDSTDFLRNDDRFEVVHWTAPMGEPRGGVTSSTQSQWTASLTAAGTFSWQVHSVKYECSAVGNVAKHVLLVNPGDSDAPTQWDPAAADLAISQRDKQAVYEWVMAVGETASAVSLSAAIGIHMPTILGAQSWRLQVLHGQSQAVLFDEHGIAPLATLSGIDLTVGEQDEAWRFRLAISPAASPTRPTAILMARKEGGDTWAETGTVNLPAPTAAVGDTQIRIEFGNLGHASGSLLLSFWREVRVFGQLYRVAYTDFDSEDLPGARAAVRPRGMGTGSTTFDTNPSRLRMAWGGGGGVAGDLFAYETEHYASAESTLIDSPQVPWTSIAGATARLTYLQYDACGGGDDDGRRFVHEGIALFGMQHRRAEILYADDEAFSTGVTTPATIDTDIVGGVRVTSRTGSVLALSTMANIFVDGGIAGRFLRVTAGSGLGTIHKVERDWLDGTTRRVALATGGQFPAVRISAGDTLSIFSDRAVVAYSTVQVKRFLRVTAGSSSDNAWKDTWRVGNAIAGKFIDFGDLLDWNHSDAEQPGTVVQRTRGGQSWAYQESPPSRTFTGRLIGSVEGERQAIRELVRTLAGYETRPVAFLLSEESQSDQERHLVLSRWMGGTTLDNPAWARREDGVLRTVGDLAVILEEIV